MMASCNASGFSLRGRPLRMVGFHPAGGEGLLKELKGPVSSHIYGGAEEPAGEYFSQASVYLWSGFCAARARSSDRAGFALGTAAWHTGWPNGRSPSCAFLKGSQRSRCFALCILPQSTGGTTCPLEMVPRDVAQQRLLPARKGACSVGCSLTLRGGGAA